MSNSIKKTLSMVGLTVLFSGITGFSSESSAKEELGILFVGKTGAGKSSTINTFYNVITGYHLQYSEPAVIIPYWRYGKSVSVNVDEFKKDAPVLRGTGLGQTKVVAKYTAENEKYKVNLYDAPGFGDPDNLRSTLEDTRIQLYSALSKHKIHAIVLVQKYGDQNRLTPEIRHWIAQTLSMLPRSSSKNLYGAFTYSTPMAEYLADEMQEDFLTEFNLENQVLALENSWLFSSRNAGSILSFNSNQIHSFLEQCASRNSSVQREDFYKLSASEKKLKELLSQVQANAEEFTDQMVQLTLVKENLQVMEERAKNNEDHYTIEEFIYPDGADGGVPSWIKVVPTVLETLPLPPEYSWVKVVVPVILEALAGSGGVKYKTAQVRKIDEFRRKIFEDAIRDSSQLRKLILELTRKQQQVFKMVQKHHRLLKNNQKLRTELAFSVSEDLYQQWLSNRISQTDDEGDFIRKSALERIQLDYLSF